MISFPFSLSWHDVRTLIHIAGGMPIARFLQVGDSMEWMFRESGFAKAAFDDRGQNFNPTWVKN
jgi:hypothetical protein